HTPSAVAAITPVRMSPAWAMLEYASIRLKSVCAMAMTAPTTMVSADRTQRNGVQSEIRGWRPTSNTRIRAANAATLVAADMYAVTGKGAPWYTSGVHMWKGTAATLNAKPTANRPAATRPSACEPFPESARAMPVMLVVPAAP